MKREIIILTLQAVLGGEKCPRHTMQPPTSAQIMATPLTLWYQGFSEHSNFLPFPARSNTTNCAYPWQSPTPKQQHWLTQISNLSVLVGNLKHPNQQTSSPTALGDTPSSCLFRLLFWEGEKERRKHSSRCDNLSHSCSCLISTLQQWGTCYDFLMGKLLKVENNLRLICNRGLL